MGGIDVQATLKGLDVLAGRIKEATRQIAADAAHLVQVESMKAAPVGKPGNSTNAPGDLARSIYVTGPVGSGFQYRAMVGPTVIYGRQRELGGDIYPKRAAILVFTKNSQVVFTKHVHQVADPYMLRGEMAALPLIEARARATVAKAIAGS